MSRKKRSPDLNDTIPDHSTFSKTRTRKGTVKSYAQISLQDPDE